MSIYKDKKTGGYVVQVQRTGPRGIKIRRCQRITGVRSDATKLEVEMTAELEESVASQFAHERLAKERRLAERTLGIDPTKPNASAALPTLRAFYMDRVVPHLKALYSPASLQKAVSPWSYLLFAMGDVPLDEITTQVIHKYEESMTAPGAARCFHVKRDGKFRKPRAERLSNGSVNKHVQHLMAALRLAADEGVLEIVPRARLLPSDDTQEVLPPTEEEFAHLLTICEDFREVAPFLPEVVTFAAETGVRESELMNLNWTQVENSVGDKGALRIERRTKGRSRAGTPYRPKHGKFRVVPLSTKARAVLDTMRGKVPTGPEDRLFPNRGGAPYVRIEHDPTAKGTGYYPSAVEAAGLKGKVTFHALRHLFAVRCLARGIPMPVVSDYLGHSSIELTVKLYGRFSDEAAAKWKWIELLDDSVDTVATRRQLTVLNGGVGAAQKREVSPLGA